MLARWWGACSVWLWVAPALIILLLIYVYPLLQVLRISVTEPAAGLGNYRELALNPGIRRVFWTTFRISGITTIVAVFLAYIVAYVMVHTSPRHMKLMLLCVLVPFWISVLVRAFSWVVILRGEGLINTALMDLGLIDEPLDLLYNESGVIIGMVHYMVPLGVLTLYGQMIGIDKRLMAAARGLGASRWVAFRRVFLPLSLPGILAAAILIFIFALGFYIVPALLGGGKTLMLAEYVGAMITQTLHWGVGTAMASTLMLMVFALIFVLSRVVDLRRVFGGT